MEMPFSEATLDDFLSTPRKCALEAVRSLNGDVLVLGAAGKMGLHLCLMLKKAFEANGQKNRVLAVSRFSSAGSREMFEKLGISTIACDLSDPVALQSLPDTENLWFMAGVKFGSSSSPALLQKMNVEMPELVARRFSKARMVAFSTGCVYPFVSPESGGATEETPVAPVGEYAESCLGREESFRRVSLEEGARVVMIRLNYSVEMRYGVLVDIAQKVMHGQPVDLEMGYFNCIWQADAVAHIIAAIELATSPSSVLNVTGPETLTVRDTAQKFACHFGVEPHFEGEEAATAWLNDASAAIARFGAPEVTAEQMIPWIAQWLKSGGSLLGKPTKFEVRDGKF